MVLRLKTWESRSPPGPPTIPQPRPRRHPATAARSRHHPAAPARPATPHAGWSSPVARQAHNLKVAGSNPAPATSFTCTSRSSCTRPPGRVLALWPSARIAARSPAHLDRQPAVLRHQHDRLDQRRGSPRAPRGRPRPPGPRAAPPPSAGRPRPGRDAAAASARSAVASSASSASRRRSSSCIRAFIDGSYSPSSIARIRPSIRRLTSASSLRLAASPAPALGLQPVPLGGELGHEHRVAAPGPSAGGAGRRAPCASSTSRRMVSRLAQVPLLRAVEQPKWCRLILAKPPPHTPQRIRPGEQVARPAPVPERAPWPSPSRLAGHRRLPRLDRLPELVVDDPQLRAPRPTTRCAGSLSRDTRLPVLGSLT